MQRIFHAAGRDFPLTRTYVMGILNVTPDSFSDGGAYFAPESAVRRAEEMAREGVDVIDVGGQSTRPGAVRLSPEEEWARISAVLLAVLWETDCAVSVDTFYPEVAEKALLAGAHILNDVTGFSDNMWRAAARTDCGCIVMHPGAPENTGGAGGDILETVCAFFKEKTMEAAAHGISAARLCFDPGIGFGKSMEENLLLLANPDAVRLPQSALLMASSRKRVISAVCGEMPAAQRVAGTVAAHSVSAFLGADMVRAHDTLEAVQAARMTDALLAHRKES